jgi:CheY-like chemotaxis protein
MGPHTRTKGQKPDHECHSILNQEGAMKNKRILIVEDEKVVREFLMLQLSKWGYKVTEAEDGVQAILKLGKDNFDLIISDIMMPDKDGWELIKEVRLSPKTKNIPIIVLTTNDKDSDMFKGYELGANYYIPKPFTKAQLLHGIIDLRKSNATLDLHRMPINYGIWGVVFVALLMLFSIA